MFAIIQRSTKATQKDEWNYYSVRPVVQVWQAKVKELFLMARRACFAWGTKQNSNVPHNIQRSKVQVWLPGDLQNKKIILENVCHSSSDKQLLRTHIHADQRIGTPVTILYDAEVTVFTNVSLVIPCCKQIWNIHVTIKISSAMYLV